MPLRHEKARSLLAASLSSTLSVSLIDSVRRVWRVVRRVQLSLSGKILVHFADQFLVQWPQLAERYPGKARYIGRLC